MSKSEMAENVIRYIYDTYGGTRFAFVYIANVHQDTDWAVKGHPMIEHKGGFGNVLRNIADKLDKMYEKRYTKRLKA